MKKTKVIIPALGLLLLSTAASVTGTVAWFAANSSVTATGMNIKAMTDSEFLVISKSSTLANLSTVALNSPATSGENAKQVLPTNWINTAEQGQTAAYSWVSASGTATDNGAQSGGYTALTINEANNLGSVTATSKNYYVFDSVYIGLASGSSQPASTKKIVCDAKFTATAASAFNPCLTVGLDVEANMGTSSDFDKRIVMGSATVGETSVAHLTTDSLLTGDQLSTTGKQIKIYVFFNGDHSACTTANALNLDNIQIDLTFSLVDANQ